MKKAYMIITLAVSLATFVALTRSEEKTRELEKIRKTPFWPNTVWGEPFKGAALSICPRKKQYAVGEKVEISVVVKNVGQDELLLPYVKPRPKRRIALFHLDGRPVAKTQLAKEADASFGQQKLPGKFSMGAITIEPGETWPDPLNMWVFRLDERFRIDKPGTYMLIVLQQLSFKDTSFLISNMAEITITEQTNAP